MLNKFIITATTTNQRESELNPTEYTGVNKKVSLNPKWERPDSTLTGA